MDAHEKIQQLRDEIKCQLKPLIGEKCILTDLPYHNNLGDVLIWQGELDFLESINKKPINQSNYLTFSYPQVDDQTTILLHGGGNFGDLYRVIQEFRLKVISNYLDRRIIVFPQSVWYSDTSLIAKDSKILSTHNDLYICARDKVSYDFMKKHFPTNNILLVPDMAFCIDESRLMQYRKKYLSKKLYFKRLDKEAALSTPLELGQDYDVHDWPTIENNSNTFYSIYKTWGLARRLKYFFGISNILYSISDIYASKVVKNKLVKQACKFLSPYGSVVTTRLHAMILSVLLHKNVEYIDNTTGKLSAFADTWLKDCKNIKQYNP